MDTPITAFLAELQQKNPKNLSGVEDVVADIFNEFCTAATCVAVSPALLLAAACLAPACLCSLLHLGGCSVSAQHWPALPVMGYCSWGSPALQLRRPAQLFSSQLVSPSSSAFQPSLSLFGCGHCWACMCSVCSAREAAFSTCCSLLEFLQ